MLAFVQGFSTHRKPFLALRHVVRAEFEKAGLAAAEQLGAVLPLEARRLGVANERLVAGDLGSTLFHEGFSESSVRTTAEQRHAWNFSILYH